MPQEFTTTPGCTTESQSTQQKTREQTGTAQHTGAAQQAGTAQRTGAAQAQAQAAKHEAERATRDVREQASAVADRARHGLGEAAESAKHATTDAVHRAREGAQSFMVRQKDSAAEEIEHVGAAVQRAAQKLHEEEDHNIASYVEAAATRAHATAQYLKQHDLNDLLADAETLARRRPAIFYGGMFAAGLAMARFLKADRPAPSARQSSTEAERWSQQRHPITTTT